MQHSRNENKQLKLGQLKRPSQQYTISSGQAAPESDMNQIFTGSFAHLESFCFVAKEVIR